MKSGWMRVALVTLSVIATTIACDDKVDWDGPDGPVVVPPFPEDWIGGMCGALFGNPTASSGLTEDQCQPSCNCDSLEYEMPEYTQEDLERLDAMVLLTPLESLTFDPYQAPEAFTLREAAVCGVQWDAEVENGYHLQTYDSESDAIAAGATITHLGACGLCSTLHDLAVYIRQPDLTNPVRSCAFLAISQGEQASIDCLAELGFTQDCSEIWYYNTVNTRNQCLGLCLTRMKDPHHLPNGALNPCIQCDEDKSGPIFKAVAGRTRRNSGLGVALCRPCDQVRPINHHYTIPEIETPPEVEVP